MSTPTKCKRHNLESIVLVYSGMRAQLKNCSMGLSSKGFKIYYEQTTFIAEYKQFYVLDVNASSINIQTFKVDSTNPHPRLTNLQSNLPGGLGQISKKQIFSFPEKIQIQLNLDPQEIHIPSKVSAPLLSVSHSSLSDSGSLFEENQKLSRSLLKNWVEKKDGYFVHSSFLLMSFKLIALMFVFSISLLFKNHDYMNGISPVPNQTCIRDLGVEFYEPQNTGLWYFKWIRPQLQIVSSSTIDMMALFVIIGWYSYSNNSSNSQGDGRQQRKNDVDFNYLLSAKSNNPRPIYL